MQNISVLDKKHVLYGLSDNENSRLPSRVLLLEYKAHQYMKKDNLHQLFDVGKEVITYQSPAEALERIKYYIENHEEREDIALAGQARTLRGHTYRKRMEELDLILKDYLKVI